MFATPVAACTRASASSRANVVDESGEHELKGVTGTWRLYAVVDG
jgi:hypothetical protein